MMFTSRDGITLIGLTVALICLLCAGLKLAEWGVI
jgi:hypothetical protein